MNEKQITNSSQANLQRKSIIKSPQTVASWSLTMGFLEKKPFNQVHFFKKTTTTTVFSMENLTEPRFRVGSSPNRWFERLWCAKYYCFFLIVMQVQDPKYGVILWTFWLIVWTEEAITNSQNIWKRCQISIQSDVMWWLFVREERSYVSCFWLG